MMLISALIHYAFLNAHIKKKKEEEEESTSQGVTRWQITLKSSQEFEGEI